MKALDLSLYLVLDPDLCGGPAGMIETARLAAANGATVVQLRAPSWKNRQWLSTARELKAVLAPFGVPLIINDQIDVALAVDAEGVHVGQDDLPADVVRQLIGPEKWLGLSITCADELAGLPGGGVVDYLGIGPVYPTGSKADAAPATGVAAFGEMVQAAGLPVVAIGGIQRANCAALFEAGSDGVAVISAICGQTDPATATRMLAERIRAIRPTPSPIPLRGNRG